MQLKLKWVFKSHKQHVFGGLIIEGTTEKVAVFLVICNPSMNESCEQPWQVYA